MDQDAPWLLKAVFLWLLLYYICSANDSQSHLGRQIELYPVTARQCYYGIPSTQSYGISYPISIFGCLARRPDFLG